MKLEYREKQALMRSLDRMKVQNETVNKRYASSRSIANNNLYNKDIERIEWILKVGDR